MVGLSDGCRKRTYHVERSPRVRRRWCVSRKPRAGHCVPIGFDIFRGTFLEEKVVSDGGRLLPGPFFHDGGSEWRSSQIRFTACCEGGFPARFSRRVVCDSSTDGVLWGSSGLFFLPLSVTKIFQLASRQMSVHNFQKIIFILVLSYAVARSYWLLLLEFS